MLTVGSFHDLFGDFSYWGYPQWPWYMKDKTTFIVYSFFELSLLWGIFFYTIYNKYKRKKYYFAILYFNFLFYIFYVYLDFWLYSNI